MAHNSFIHGGTASPTAWLPGYVPVQLDWQKIDQLLFESINGDQGGTWAPASVITIGGSGLTVSGTFIGSGTNTLSGTTTTGVLNIHGQSFVWNKMTIDGANTGEIQVTSGGLVDGLAGSTFTWAGDFTVSHTSTFSAKPTINAAMDCTGLATFSGTLASTTTLTAAVVTVATSLTLSVGAVMPKRQYVGPDADVAAGTITVGKYDYITISAITANRTYKIDDAPNGTMMQVSFSASVSNGVGFHVVLQTAAAVVITTIWFQGTSLPDGCDLIVRGGSWEVAQLYYYHS